MANKSVSPPQKWNPQSKKWESKLKQLSKLQDTDVTKVGKLIFVPEKKFQIARNGETEVLLGLWHDGTELAIKKMPLSQFNNVETALKKLKAELNSQNIVSYIDTAKDSDFGYVALQLCEDNLEKHKTALKSIGDPKSKVQEVLKDLSDLHEKNVTHGNLKPQNVLFDSTGKMKLADFGDLKMGQTMENGAGWKATEIIKEPSTKSSPTSDIQVAGMLVYYMLSGGKHPFGDGSRRNNNILTGKYTLQDIDVEAKDLIESMINSDPKKRPKIFEVLQHPYFWDGDKKKTYLKNAAEVQEVQDLKKATAARKAKLIDQTKEKSFSNWKSELKDSNQKEKWLAVVQKHGKDGVEYPENMLGLLHFLQSHSRKADMKEINIMELFPDLIVTVWKYAKEKKWDIHKGDTAATSKRKTDASAAKAQAASKAAPTPPKKPRTTSQKSSSKDKGQEFFSKNKAALETRISAKSILMQLAQKKVLNDVEREEVESRPTSTEQNSALLSMIQRKGGKAQQVFYDVLKETDPYLVEDLTKTPK